MTSAQHGSNRDGVDNFYRDYWNSPVWGSSEPNDDERARAAAIMEMLRNLSMPADRGSHLPQILDVGCGRGWLTYMLSHFGNARGIDPTTSSVVRARELFPGIDFYDFDVLRLLEEVGPGTFDLVVSSEVIEHIENKHKPAFLESIHALLKTDGHAILTTPRGELWAWYQYAARGLQPIEQWISERELVQLAQQQGFEVIRKSRIFVRGYPYCLPARVLGIRRLRRLIEPSCKAWPMRRLRDRLGIYQILLLRRAR